MANLELLTLAKALSVKNRLAGRLAQARENIETYNSVLAGQRDDYGKATVTYGPSTIVTASFRTA